MRLAMPRKRCDVHVELVPASQPGTKIRFPWSAASQIRQRMNQKIDTREFHAPRTWYPGKGFGPHFAGDVAAGQRHLEFLNITQGIDFTKTTPISGSRLGPRSNHLSRLEQLISSCLRHANYD